MSYKIKAGIFGDTRENKDKKIGMEIKKILQGLKVKVNDAYFDIPSSEKRKRPLETYKVLSSIMSNCDIIVVEQSSYSTGLGLIIGIAVGMKKPTLVLYNPERAEPTSVVVEAYKTSNRLEYVDYTDETLEAILKEFVEKARKQVNRSFIVRLDPDLSRFLDWFKESDSRSSADIFRKFLRDEMRDNVNWKKYKKDERMDGKFK